ncbi:hypothetical protein C8A01DRAFT_32129 [Parachaetomium inaequale]|uniref:Ig-like domain-containing protein n=1 Tax=Parachaetomium inaequale TaxID=2588326 RepID=A0AAN6PMK2_9PEZI|nr:hypothetical protein C8A01DRAFT_32129 [Parachaetomium inaequale]
MHIVTILTSAALLTLGVSAGAIHKRSGEGVHLANCYQNSALGQIGYSQMLYYADDAQASQNVKPSSSNQCYVTQPGQGGFQTWEGSTVACTFPSGTTFTSNLPRGVQWYSTGSYAGIYYCLDA